MSIYELFIQILRMGATASIVILAVFLVRALMRRFPKKYAYLLWIIVGIRLVCPTALSSPVSLFNLKPLADSRHAAEPYVSSQYQPAKSADNTNNHMTMEASEQGKNHTEKNNGADQPDNNRQSSTVRSSSDSEKTQNTSSLTKTADTLTGTARISSETVTYQVLHTLSLIWLTGVIALLLWNVYLTIRMKRQLSKAVLYRDHIYECDNIPSPFVMRLLRPRIYIPFRLSDTEREYILAHEQYHIRRKDYLIKAAAFFIVILYWFHPLVWISYFCMVRDMEMSCDEYVLTASDTEIRQHYSQSLLAFATNQRHFSMGLLSFGETDTRRRVKHILKFRKKRKWMGIIAVLLVAGAALVCLTNGKSSTKRIDPKKSPDAEASLVRKMKTAVTTVMPKKVTDEIKNKQWKKTGTDTYSVANTEDFDSTLRLDFTFKENVLTYYTSKEYGFVDDMPKEKITKKQAIVLLQKFAENFLDRKLDKTEFHVAKTTPPRYDNKDYLTVEDTQGGFYVVQLSHNMVVLFTQTEIVYVGEDEPVTPSEIRQIISAKLSYRGKTENDSVTQTITNQNTLDTLEQILSEATEFRGGITCPFGDAVLTLYLAGGKEMELTWACDGCRIFRLNGVYYGYIDEFLSTSPDGIRGFFDKIPWKRQG